MHKTFFILLLLAVSSKLFGQETNKDSADSRWSFSLGGYFYFIPEDKNTYTLIGSADHKNLHLETRYNYEDVNTASAFAGWRFDLGKKVQFSVTPMLGFAVGNSDGLVPAVELEASYKKFDFYSESEYMIDFAAKENNFFYVWSELAITPVDPLRTGISIQKTRLYQTGRDVQRGVFAEYSFWKLTAGVYYFNPFSSEDFVICSLSIAF
jgi:hypothetical protein